MIPIAEWLIIGSCVFRAFAHVFRINRYVQLAWLLPPQYFISRTASPKMMTACQEARVPQSVDMTQSRITAVRYPQGNRDAPDAAHRNGLISPSDDGFWMEDVMIGGGLDTFPWVSQ
jgi:hypothetical protein